MLVVSRFRPHGRTDPSRAASDWTRHHDRRARGFTPRPPSARYLGFLELLLLDRDDFQLRRLHKALTRCAAFQQATNGQVSTRVNGGVNFPSLGEVIFPRCAAGEIRRRRAVQAVWAGGRGGVVAG